MMLDFTLDKHNLNNLHSETKSFQMWLCMSARVCGCVASSSCSCKNTQNTKPDSLRIKLTELIPQLQSADGISKSIPESTAV